MTTTDELEHLAAEYVEHVERSVPAVLVVVRSADELRRAPIVTARITRGDRDLPGQAFAGAVVGATCVLKRATRRASFLRLPHAPTQPGS